MEKIETIITVIKNNPFLYNGVKILGVLILVLLGISIGNRVIDALLNDKRKNKTEEEQRRIVTLNHISRTLLKVVVISIAVIDVLSIFIDVKAILTVAGIGTIAIGIGAQAIVEDMLSGFVILSENLFSVGEYIQLDGNHYGKVEKIGLRMTHIRQIDDSIYIIHNGEITKLTNYSKGSIRAAIEVGVAFEENLEKVYNILEHLFDQIMVEKKGIYLKRPEIMGVTELGDSAVVIRIEADVRAGDKKKIERDLRQAVKEIFDQNGVEIPYNKYIFYAGRLDGQDDEND